MDISREERDRERRRQNVCERTWSERQRAMLKTEETREFDSLSSQKGESERKEEGERDEGRARRRRGGRKTVVLIKKRLEKMCKCTKRQKKRTRRSGKKETRKQEV